MNGWPIAWADRAVKAECLPSGFAFAKFAVKRLFFLNQPATARQAATAKPCMLSFE